MSQFKMLRALVYVLVGLGWLALIGGILLAAASFMDNSWTLQLNLPLIAGSRTATGFAVLLAASILTISFLASAEMIVLMLESYTDIKKIREFFQKK